MKISALLLTVLALAACNDGSRPPPNGEPEAAPSPSGDAALKPWEDYINQVSIDKSDSRWRLKLSQPPIPRWRRAISSLECAQAFLSAS